MITFQKEPFMASKAEINELCKLHYDEIALNKDYIPLDPDWDKYQLLENKDGLVFITARDEGKLVGYSLFFLTNHIHYKSTKMALNDILFLHPDYRKGTTGVKLIKLSELELKKLKVDRISWHIKFHKDFRKILYRMGYRDEEVTVAKILKE